MNHSLSKFTFKKSLSIYIVFFIVGFLIYFPSLNSDPFWDDWYFIFKSWTMNHASALEYWKWGEYKRSWPLFYSAMSLMLKAWGNSYLYYHLFSLVLHVSNAFLIYHFLKTIRGSYAFLLALLYLVHPLNVFNVIWIIQLKTLLAIFFFLLSISLFANSEKSKLNYILSFVFYAASIFSKAVFIPVILLFPFYKKKLRLIPFILISIYSGILTVWNSHLKVLLSDLGHKWVSFFINSSYADDTQLAIEAASKIARTPFDSIVITMVNLTKYTSYIFFPQANLLVHPSTNITNSFFEMAGFILLILVLYKLVEMAIEYNKKEALMGVAFYLISLIPLCGIFFVPIFHYSNFVEYWLAVPALGLVFAFSQIPQRINITLIMSLIVGAFFIKSAYSIRKTPDPVRIVNASVEASPKNVLIPMILAKHYYYKGDYVKSLEVLTRVKKNLKSDPQKINLEIEESLKGMRGEIINDYTL